MSELLKYSGAASLLTEFEIWEPPVFPVGGLDLADAGLTNRRIFSVVLAIMRDRWIESTYCLTKGQLLAMLDEISELALAQSKAKQRSPKQKRKRSGSKETA